MSGRQGKCCYCVLPFYSTITGGKKKPLKAPKKDKKELDDVCLEFQ